MRIRVRFSVLFIIISLLGACSAPSEPSVLVSFPATEIPLTIVAVPSAIAQIIGTPTLIQDKDTIILEPFPTEEILPAEIVLDPDNWMSWPEIPIVTRQMSDVYLFGQTLGNNPHAISVFGDCQSVPETFLGLYEKDDAERLSLPPNLQETVDYFGDSLNRESPTAKDGTTSGALLWSEWHEGKYGCQDNETPLDCELRLHNPSFVIISVGTHREANHMVYMRKIIENLLEQGVVPILSTKADNREGDNKINFEAAVLAKEYGLPLWNFWAVTKDLPNQGLYTKKIDEHLGDIYLTEEALSFRRYSALMVLDTVWQSVAGK